MNPSQQGKTPKFVRTHCCYQLSVDIWDRLLPSRVRLQRLAFDVIVMVRTLSAGEVYVSITNVGTDEPGFEFVAYVETLRALGEQSLNAGLKNADKDAVIGGTGDDRVEDFADAVLHGDSREAFGHLALYFSSRIFFLRAVRRDGSQLVVGIRICLTCEHCFNQPLRDNVGETPVRRRGVRIVLYREAKVAGGSFARALQNVLTGTDEFDDGKGDVGKMIGIGSFAPQQKIVQGL
jgi:hypothetical protein